MNFFDIRNVLFVYKPKVREFAAKKQTLFIKCSEVRNTTGNKCCFKIRVLLAANKGNVECECLPQIARIAQISRIEELIVKNLKDMGAGSLNLDFLNIST
jgi:hypothetical protein